MVHPLVYASCYDHCLLLLVLVAVCWTTLVHLAHGWRRLKAVAVAILKVIVLYREALLFALPCLTLDFVPYFLSVASSLLGWVVLDCCPCCASVVLMAILVMVASVEEISAVVLFPCKFPLGTAPVMLTLVIVPKPNYFFCRLDQLVLGIFYS